MWMYIINGSGESLVYLDHESYLKKCDEKLVKVNMSKVIQTNFHFMCLGSEATGAYRRFYLTYE